MLLFHFLVHIYDFTLYNLDHLLGLLYLLSYCLSLSFEVVEGRIVRGLDLQLGGYLSQVMKIFRLLVNFLD